MRTARKRTVATLALAIFFAQSAFAGLSDAGTHGTTGIRYFSFGRNPVDPARELRSGECLIALHADSPFPVTVNGRRGNELFSDTAYIKAREEIVIDDDGTALYVKKCGNDILSPKDWKPGGEVVRCKSHIAETIPTETATTTLRVYRAEPNERLIPSNAERPTPSLQARAEPKKKRWPWVLVGIIGGIAIGAALHDDDDDTNITVVVENNACQGNCRER